MSCVSLFGSSMSFRYYIFFRHAIFLSSPLLACCYMNSCSGKKKKIVHKKKVWIVELLQKKKKKEILFLRFSKASVDMAMAKILKGVDKSKLLPKEYTIVIDVVGFLSEGQVCLFVTKLFCLFFVFFHVSNYFFYDYVDKVSSFSSKFKSIANVKWY